MTQMSCPTGVITHFKKLCKENNLYKELYLVEENGFLNTENKLRYMSREDLTEVGINTNSKSQILSYVQQSFTQSEESEGECQYSEDIKDDEDDETDQNDENRDKSEFNELDIDLSNVIYDSPEEGMGHLYEFFGKYKFSKDHQKIIVNQYKCKDLISLQLLSYWQWQAIMDTFNQSRWEVTQYNIRWHIMTHVLNKFQLDCYTNAFLDNGVIGLADLTCLRNEMCEKIGVTKNDMFKLQKMLKTFKIKVVEPIAKHNKKNKKEKSENPEKLPERQQTGNKSITININEHPVIVPFDIPKLNPENRRIWIEVQKEISNNEIKTTHVSREQLISKLAKKGVEVNISKCDDKDSGMDKFEQKHLKSKNIVKSPKRGISNKNTKKRNSIEFKKAVIEMCHTCGHTLKQCICKC